MELDMHSDYSRVSPVMESGLQYEKTLKLSTSSHVQTEKRIYMIFNRSQLSPLAFHAASEALDCVVYHGAKT